MLLLACIILWQGKQTAMAQLLEEKLAVAEASIIPAYLQYNVDLGKAQTQKVQVTNNTEKTQKYRVNYQDFELSNTGESSFLEAGTCEESLAGMLTITPGSFDIGPGETSDISLTVTIPPGSQSPGAAWGMIMIEQVDANNIAINSQTKEVAAEPGFTPALAYGVWLYQNPPKAENNIDITNFIIGNTEKNKGIFLKVKNKGDGISICNPYVEITNLTTGELIIIEGKQYTILPGSKQTLVFELEEELPKGSYSAMGIVDRGTEEEMVATELEFKIQ